MGQKRLKLLVFHLQHINRIRGLRIHLAGSIAKNGLKILKTSNTKSANSIKVMKMKVSQTFQKKSLWTVWFSETIHKEHFKVAISHWLSVGIASSILEQLMPPRASTLIPKSYGLIRSLICLWRFKKKNSAHSGTFSVLILQRPSSNALIWPKILSL